MSVEMNQPHVIIHVNTVITTKDLVRSAPTAHKVTKTFKLHVRSDVTTFTLLIINIYDSPDAEVTLS